jgi:hypothetical protein
MALATQTDVETSLMRVLTDSESQYVVQLLARAEALLSARVQDLTTNTAFHDLAVAVEADAVARVFRNPAGYKQETEGNYGYSLNFEVASGLLSILDAEWERFGIGGVGSIAPKMDGYAAARYSIRPDLAFQYGWPAPEDDTSEVIV